jgi:quinoprotein glucose dehydrogenase
MAWAVTGFTTVTAAGLGPLLAGQAPGSERTLASGAYSAAQQKRGAATYNRECSTCHGETLKGGEGSPALTGASFASSFDGQPVAALFTRIRETMPAPPEQPGKLTAEETAEVVAHILSANGFPAGDVALPADLDALGRLTIRVKR